MKQQTSLARYLWIGMGGLSVGIGTIGIVLPVLPTFPFYLFAVFCFAKGSTRLHQRFVSSKLYQSTVGEFLQSKSLPLRVKVRIILTFTFMMGAGFYFMHYTWSRALLAIVWVVHVYYIGWRIPTQAVQEVSS